MAAQLSIFHRGDDARPLGDVRAEVRAALDDGIYCPCCGQFAKRYKRKLTSSMAYTLIVIARYFSGPAADEWLHVENHIKSQPGLPMALRGDFPKLRFWGFIEQKTGLRDDLSPRSGFWRITHNGKRFARGLISAPSHALIYNGEFERLVGRDITIRDALGERFNYAELMGWL